MNFRPRQRDLPELNLIPMIDVLIVLLIFLVLTTTFSRNAQLEVRLPEALGATGTAAGGGLDVVISAMGDYRVNDHAVPDKRQDSLRQALTAAAGANSHPVLTISADRNTPHQAVIAVLDAAGQLGFKQVRFAAERSPSGSP
jgi:biopolymer transport protein ExbD